MKTTDAEPDTGQLPEKDCCTSSNEVVNLAQANPGEVCIDLGCGTGTHVFRLAQDTGSNGFVFGLEKSNELVKEAFSTAENLGITNIDFIHSGIENIKLGNGIADLLISNCTISRVSNKKHIWDEIYRVLKKGGRFVVSDIYITTPIPEGNSNSAGDSAKCRMGAVTRGEYLKILYNTGFVSLRILEESLPYIKDQASIVSFTIRGEKPDDLKAGRCRI